MAISFLEHSSIDPLLWDSCLKNSSNGLIYGCYQYLNIVTDEQWDAIVIGDYDTVIPLPRRQAFYQQYIYRPILTQQLGPFGKKISATTAKKIVTMILKHCSDLNLPLSDASAFGNNPKVSLHARTNLILDLRAPIEAIQKKYSKNLKRCIKKGAKHYDQIKEISITQFIKLYDEHLEEKLKLGPDKKNRMKHLLVYLKKEKYGTCYQVEENGAIGAAAFIPKFNTRWTYLLGLTTSMGRENKAMHFLMDQIIQLAITEQITVFDFEGSDMKNIRSFYERFAPYNEGYTEIRWQAGMANIIGRIREFRKGKI